MSKGIFDSSLKSHIENGKRNGITKSEMAEIITHAAFYAGWPNAWATFNIAKEVYTDGDAKEVHGGMFGLGEPNTNFAQYFIGNSYLNPLTKPGEGSVFLANVTFEPDAVIIGIFITQLKMVDKFLSVLMVKAGIKKKAKMPKV